MVFLVFGLYVNLLLIFIFGILFKEIIIKWKGIQMIFIVLNRLIVLNCIYSMKVGEELGMRFGFFNYVLLEFVFIGW